jgi:hypothetical protein
MWGLLTAAVPAVGPVWGPEEADNYRSRTRRLTTTDRRQGSSAAVSSDPPR